MTQTSSWLLSCGAVLRPLVARIGKDALLDSTTHRKAFAGGQGQPVTVIQVGSRRSSVRRRRHAASASFAFLSSQISDDMDRNKSISSRPGAGPLQAGVGLADSDAAARLDHRHWYCDRITPARGVPESVEEEELELYITYSDPAGQC